jgi:DNA repair exonuclease SbcCD nuclease subunit
VVISDAHLFQTFADNYDSVRDFDRAIDEIRTKIAPDMLFLAGDMFDYKKTETMYVRHYEGESHMIKIRKIIEKFGKPVYAIRGNHDKEEILAGLEQTVENFHYVKNDAKSFGDFSICFMDSFYETGGYTTDVLQVIETFLKEVISKMKRWENTLILLCHETFAPYKNAMPDSLVKFLRKNFDLILDGHMHLWNSKAYGSDSVICLPSLLPSKIAKGKYSMERYEWGSQDSGFKREMIESPFGYIVLDTESKKADFYEFTPSKKIVEVNLDITDLSLEEARKRLRTIFAEIDKRNDKNDLIILPQLKGEMTFSPLYVENVKEDFPELYIDNIRYQETILKTILRSQVVSAPTLTVEQLCEKMKNEIPNLIEEIKRKGVGIDESTLSAILKELLDGELIDRSLSIQQTRARLHMILTPINEAISKASKQERPATFEDNLANFLKMVK